MAAPVIVRLRGGLGNQMFQWAAGYALARRRGAHVCLDVREHPAGGAQPHLLRWQVPARQLRGWQAMRYPKPALAFARRQGWAGRWLGFHAEHSLRFDASLQLRPLPLLLDGYYQSERYFSDARDALRQHFVPRAALTPAQQALAASIVGGVAVHVRRGDFTSPDIAAVHGVCGAAYYLAAAKCVAAQTGARRFYVFTDDPDWAHSTLRLPGETVVVQNHGDTPEVDLHLMSLASHHVCANSSFGWWGAWLAEHRNQVVVAPKRWFASETLDASDIVPARWLRL